MVALALGEGVSVTAPATWAPPLAVGPDVRVWRIEHPDDGVGPFNASMDQQYAPRWYLNQREWEEQYPDVPPPHRMPIPRVDTVVRQGALPLWDYWRFEPTLKFGFQSLNELRYWFCGLALCLLDQHGYVVRELRVPWEAHTRFRHQVRFDSTRAVLLRTHTPTDLFWL